MKARHFFFILAAIGVVGETGVLLYIRLHSAWLQTAIGSGFVYTATTMLIGVATLVFAIAATYAALRSAAASEGQAKAAREQVSAAKEQASAAANQVIAANTQTEVARLQTSISKAQLAEQVRPVLELRPTSAGQIPSRGTFDLVNVGTGTAVNLWYRFEVDRDGTEESFESGENYRTLCIPPQGRLFLVRPEGFKESSLPLEAVTVTFDDVSGGEHRVAFIVQPTVQGGEEISTMYFDVERVMNGRDKEPRH